MYVMSVANQKGGVGKTTTAFNFIGCLSSLWKRHPERKILAVDMDPQSHLSLLIGQGRYPETSMSVQRIFDEVVPEALPEIIHPTRFGNTWMVPATIALSGEELRAYLKTGWEQRLYRFLLRSATGFDMVVIDCPPNLNVFTMNALVASDGVIIPMAPEHLPTEGAAQFSKTLEIVRTSQQMLGRKTIRTLGVVTTLYDGRIQTHNIFRDILADEFPGEQYLGDVHTASAIKDATARSLTMAEFDKKSRAYREYLAVTKSIMTRISTSDSSMGTSSFIDAAGDESETDEPSGKKEVLSLASLESDEMEERYSAPPLSEMPDEAERTGRIRGFLGKLADAENVIKSGTLSFLRS